METLIFGGIDLPNSSGSNPLALSEAWLIELRLLGDCNQIIRVADSWFIDVAQTFASVTGALVPSADAEVGLFAAIVAIDMLDCFGVEDELIFTNSGTSAERLTFASKETPIKKLTAKFFDRRTACNNSWGSLSCN